MTIGELNRKITPEYHQIKEIPIIRAEKHYLSNNVPLYTINAGNLDIIKIEFIFKAGSWFEPNFWKRYSGKIIHMDTKIRWKTLTRLPLLNW